MLYDNTNFYDGYIQTAVFRHYVVAELYGIDNIITDEKERSELKVPVLSNELRRKAGLVGCCAEETERFLFLLGLGVIDEDFLSRVLDLLVKFSEQENEKSYVEHTRRLIFEDIINFEEYVIEMWRRLHSKELDEDNINYKRIYKYLLLAIKSTIDNNFIEKISFKECMDLLDDGIATAAIEITDNGHMYIKDTSIVEYLIKCESSFARFFGCINENGDIDELSISEIEAKLFDIKDDKEQNKHNRADELIVLDPLAVIYAVDIYSAKYGKEFIEYLARNNCGGETFEFNSEIRDAYESYVDKEKFKYTITPYERKRYLFDGVGCSDMDYCEVSVGDKISFLNLISTSEPSVYSYMGNDETAEGLNKDESDALYALKEYHESRADSFDACCFKAESVLFVKNLGKVYVFLYKGGDDFIFIDSGTENNERQSLKHFYRYTNEGYESIVNKLWKEMRSETVTVGKNGSEVHIIRDVIGHSETEIQLIKNIANQQVSEFKPANKTNVMMLYEERMKAAKEVYKQSKNNKND